MYMPVADDDYFEDHLVPESGELQDMDTLLDFDMEYPDEFDQPPPSEPANPDAAEESQYYEDNEDTCSNPADDSTDTRAEAMGQLESLVLSFLGQLSAALPKAGETQAKKDKGSRITLKLADRRRVSGEGSASARCIRFPQKGKGASIKQFAQLFRIVNLMHEALVDDIPMTKRDIYYKDVQLFKNQGIVDRLVDDLAATFDLGRADLHIRASAKGLVCGSNLSIHLLGGDIISVNDSEGTLIPVGEDIVRFEVEDALSWVVIVEKEAVFQTLCRLRFASHPSLPGRGIIITGKGYPDVATRQFVKTLSDNLPANIPILALVDGDAYGLDIISVYRFGSTAMHHEKEALAANRVRWLGICSSELIGLGIPKDALIPITKHDERKALAMLRRTNLPRKWQKELQYMLHNRRKAEIEILSSIPSSTKLTSAIEENFGSDYSNGGRGQYCAKSDPYLVQYLVEKISASSPSIQDKNAADRTGARNSGFRSQVTELPRQHHCPFYIQC